MPALPSKCSSIPVHWPEGINTKITHEIIFDFFSPMVEREEVNEPIALPDGSVHGEVQDSVSESLGSNLRELLSLSDIGEAVVWPDGFTAIRARQFLMSHPF